MRQSALLLFALVWFRTLSLQQAAASNAIDDDATTNPTIGDKSNDDAVVERNPLYNEPTEENEKSTTGEINEDVTMSGGDDAKSVLERSLGASSKYRATARFLKNHRFSITMAAFLFAFRREMKSLVWNTISQSIKDPKTGEISRRLHVDLNPTAVLKAVVFVLVLRQMQQIQSFSSLISPSSLLLLGRITGNQGLALLLSGFIYPSNPAYVPPISQHYTFERLNDRYSKDAQAYMKVIGSARRTSPRRKLNTTDSTDAKAVGLSQFVTTLPFLIDKETAYNSTIVVMDWTGLDTSVSRLDVLRDEVSFLIDCFEERRDHSDEEDNFEVMVLLESPGGSASDYALAAQQVLRMRDQGINVTICVDKIAASGGYMIACTSSPGRLFAAPFALLGSIGVIGQSININNVLKGWGVTPLIFRGGKDKAPVGLIGEVTKQGKEKVQLMVDDTHRAFKRHVADSRPSVAARMEDIATGDTWLGYDALDMGLVDRIITSDEYIGERIRGGTRVLKLYKLVRSRGLFSSRVSTVSSSLDSLPHHPAAGFVQLILPIISQLSSFLGRIEESIAGLLADDFSPLKRTAVVRGASYRSC